MDKQLIVKIKMPPSGSELRFECPTCKKCFSSGKGLGGHKRVHLRTTARKNNQSQNRPSSELQIVRRPQNNADQNIHLCPVCQQQWPSEKSVHGHMRKHRDRSWRGMKPPVENGGSSLPIENGGSYAALLEGNNSGDQGDKQLVVASNGWAQRRRRHGKAPMEMIQETDKESISVAYDLMALATGDPSRKEGNSEQKKQKLELGNPGSGICFPALPWPEGAANSSRGNKYSSVVRKKKYVCNICEKAFSTYQALGGHKSHHHIPNEGNDISADQRPTAEAPSVNEVSPYPEGEKENDKQLTVFRFDLNELPPEDY